MKKIPTLFKREFRNHKVINITDEVTEGCEVWTDPECIATIKLDGACCAIIDGELYRRYDAKKGKTSPAGAIPCCDPDPVTGHWPHWLKCDPDNPADKWFIEAAKHRPPSAPEEFWEYVEGLDTRPIKTFEAIGKHFNGNPYNLDVDFLVLHGFAKPKQDEFERTFEGVKQWLADHADEGLVFWYDGEPLCKIKRTDFGFEWPMEGWPCNETSRD